MSKPYCRNSEGVDTGTYIRIGRSTLRATPEVIEELRWHSRGIDFEATPNVRSTPEDLDHRLVQQFLNARRNQARSRRYPMLECILHHIPSIHGHLRLAKVIQNCKIGVCHRTPSLLSSLNSSKEVR